MPGWLSDSQVQMAILDQLQKTNATATATLEPWWSGIVTRANAWAFNEIMGRLAERGYTSAQINSWDRGAEFQQDLAVWKALSIAAAKQPGSYSGKGIEYLDRRKELTGSTREDIAPVAILIGSAFQDPLGTAGQAAYGSYDASADLFGTPIDPDDPRLGEPVKD